MRFFSVSGDFQKMNQVTSENLKDWSVLVSGNIENVSRETFHKVESFKIWIRNEGYEIEKISFSYGDEDIGLGK